MMRLGFVTPAVLAAALAAPAPAVAAVPLDGLYTNAAAAMKRPQVVFEVGGNIGALVDVGPFACLPQTRSATGRFRIRDGRFRVTIPMRVRRVPATARDRVVMEGRWTSPHSVRGRVRAVMYRGVSNGRRRYCDSGWHKWRAARADSFEVRNAAPNEFTVPGTVTRTVDVVNDGDYDSRTTLLTLLSSAGAPAWPAPVVSTTQGACRWPAHAGWADWTGYDTDRAIFCDLGVVRARTTVRITIAESFSLEHCTDGVVEAYWDPAIRSPLLFDPAWNRVGAAFAAHGDCPVADE